MPNPTRFRPSKFEPPADPAHGESSGTTIAGEFRSPCLVVVMRLLATLLLVTLFPVTLPMHAQDPDSTARPSTLPTITVDGVAEKMVDPDQAVFLLSITTSARELANAQEENRNRTYAAAEAMRALGIPDSDIRTSSVRSQREYDWVNRERIFKGFRVSRSMTIELNDLDKLDLTLAKLLESTEIELSGTRFRLQEKDQWELDIRREAITDARKKAQAMANELGLTLGKAHTVVDTTITPAAPMPRQPAMMRMAEASGAGPSPDENLTEAAQIQLRASVRVTFLLDD